MKVFYIDACRVALKTEYRYVPSILDDLRGSMLDVTFDTDEFLEKRMEQLMNALDFSINRSSDLNHLLKNFDYNHIFKAPENETQASISTGLNGESIYKTFKIYIREDVTVDMIKKGGVICKGFVDVKSSHPMRQVEGVANQYGQRQQTIFDRTPEPFATILTQAISNKYESWQMVSFGMRSENLNYVLQFPRKYDIINGRKLIYALPRNKLVEDLQQRRFKWVQGATRSINYYLNEGLTDEHPLVPSLNALPYGRSGNNYVSFKEHPYDYYYSDGALAIARSSAPMGYIDNVLNYALAFDVESLREVE